MHRLETIRAAFAAVRFDFTEHAAERAVERNISEPEIRVAKYNSPARNRR